jgi:hypothetical protein
MSTVARARADVGLGLFLGEPTGLDLKIGLSPRSGLDLLAGWSTIDSDHANYAHVTYLLTPAVGRGESVLVPLRIGIGGAVFDSGGPFGDRLHLAVRAPLEVGLRFRRVPLEIYGEIAAVLVFVHDSGFDVDGGAGFRFYF